MDNQREHECVMQARIEALEDKFDRTRDTHKEFYDRIRELEKNDAVRDEQYGTIIDKLDGLTQTVQVITAKPGKRWDAVVDKLIFAAIGAAIPIILQFMAHTM